MNIIYDPRQLQQVATFVTKNNPAVDVTASEIMSKVHGAILKGFDSIAMGGWYCDISEESNVIHLEFYADVSIGQEPNYIEAEVKHVERIR